MNLLQAMKARAADEHRAMSIFYDEPWIPGGLPHMGRGCAADTVARILRAIAENPGIARHDLPPLASVSKAVLDKYITELERSGQITKARSCGLMTYTATEART